MDSAPYAYFSCDKCRPVRQAVEDSLEDLEAPGYVWNWVKDRVASSDYIWEITKRCFGCCKVAEYRCLVLGILLYKLGIKVR